MLQVRPSVWDLANVVYFSLIHHNLLLEWKFSVAYMFGYVEYEWKYNQKPIHTPNFDFWTGFVDFADNMA